MLQSRLMITICLAMCCGFFACTHSTSPQNAGQPSGSTEKQAVSPPVNKPPSGASGEIIFSVAASAQETMEQATAAFVKEHPNVSVKLNPGASSTLAKQISEGAPVDLFLSANVQWAEKVPAVATEKLLTNRLVLVTPKGNPAGVKEPRDLLKTEVKKIALAGDKVPAGTYADQSLTKLELLSKLTEEGKIVRGQDVRNTLSFVERGEVEAGIIYSTDVKFSDRVEIVHIFDPSLHDPIEYVLVLVRRDSETHPEAQTFFDYLRSATADETYRQFGFERIGR